MASEIYEIHIPTQVTANRVSVFLFKRKKKTGHNLEYIWPEKKIVVNGKDIEDVMQKIAVILKEDCNNITDG